MTEFESEGEIKNYVQAYLINNPSIKVSTLSEYNKYIAVVEKTKLEWQFIQKIATNGFSLIDSKLLLSELKQNSPIATYLLSEENFIDYSSALNQALTLTIKNPSTVSSQFYDTFIKFCARNEKALITTANFSFFLEKFINNDDILIDLVLKAIDSNINFLEYNIFERLFQNNRDPELLKIIATAKDAKGYNEAILAFSESEEAQKLSPSGRKILVSNLIKIPDYNIDTVEKIDETLKLGLNDREWEKLINKIIMESPTVDSMLLSKIVLSDRKNVNAALNLYFNKIKNIPSIEKNIQLILQSNPKINLSELDLALLLIKNDQLKTLSFPTLANYINRLSKIKTQASILEYLHQQGIGVKYVIQLNQLAKIALQDSQTISLLPKFLDSQDHATTLQLMKLDIFSTNPQLKIKEMFLTQILNNEMYLINTYTKFREHYALAKDLARLNQLYDKALRDNLVLSSDEFIKMMAIFEYNEMVKLLLTNPKYSKQTEIMQPVFEQIIRKPTQFKAETISIFLTNVTVKTNKEHLKTLRATQIKKTNKALYKNLKSYINKFK